MSTTNLDLPVLISAEQIRRREFVTIRMGRSRFVVDMGKPPRTLGGFRRLHP